MPTSGPPRQVLFLCTGNFYRSRFAELLFNSLAREAALPWVAQSRAIALSPAGLNRGPISPHAVLGLVERGIRVSPDIRLPLSLQQDDLDRADLVIALYEAEHADMLRERFPGAKGLIQFWQVPDIDQVAPAETLATIEREVHALLRRLGRGETA